MGNLPLYRTISDLDSSLLGIRPSAQEPCFSFFYRIDGTRCELINADGHLTDETERWDVDLHGMELNGQIGLRNPSTLFGPDGVAPEGSELGICVLWKNPQLSQAGCIVPEQSPITQASPSHNLTIIASFPPGGLSGNLDLDVCLYLRKPAPFVSDDQRFLINDAGVILGSIREEQVMTSGTSMVFPIREVMELGGPIWRLEMSEWDDPKEDEFSENNLVLVLNAADPECPKLGPSGIENKAMLCEIITQAFYLVCQKIGEGDPTALADTFNGTELEPGSISDAIYQLSQKGKENIVNYSNAESLLGGLHRTVFDVLSQGVGNV